jgi:tRNA modification GTPase
LVKVNAAAQALTQNQGAEFVAEELYIAHQRLGEITGTVTPDDLLGKIFSEFCIGK